MQGRRRVLLLGLLLVLTLSAAAWVSVDRTSASDSVVAAVSERVSKPPQEPAGKPLEIERFALSMDKLQRTPMVVGELNPFGTKSWFVPPPPVPQPPPPQPTAPPFPFIYIGKLNEDGGRTIIYLVRGEQSYALSKGETFDSVYRFDGIENGNLVFQYLPLSIKQFLPIGTES